MTADWKQDWVARACSECGHELLVPVAPAALLDAAIRERDEARAERDRYKAALEHIRDHGKTHDQPCFALSNGDCAEVMQECADAALAVPTPPTDEDKRTPR